LYLTPGPKAHDEFAAANGRRKLPKKNNSIEPEIGDRHMVRERAASHQLVTATTPMFDPALVAEFTSRGISEKRAIALIANLKPGRDVIAQLEYAEQSVKSSQIEIRNPAAYIASLIEMDAHIPDGFETRAQRKAREGREQKERTQRAMRDEQQQQEWDYDDYRETEIDRYVETHRTEFEAIKEAKWKEDRERFSFTTESMAVMSARNEIRKKITFPTFEEFLDRRKQGTDFSLKLVPASPAAELPPTLPEAPEESTPDPTKELSPDSAPQAAEPERVMPPPVMFEFASDPLPPPNEIGGNAGSNLA
jgi:hypothetical protein